MDDLTEQEITLICFASFHDDDEANEILKGTGLTLQGPRIYRNGKEIGTTHTEEHSCSMDEFIATSGAFELETDD